MKRRFVQAFVLVRTAFVGMRRSAGPTALAVMTIAVALLLGGSFGLVVANMSRLVAAANEQLEVVAYLEAGLAEEARDALRARAEAIDGVAAVVLVTPEEALARFRETAGAAIVEGLEENPLPASLELALDEAGRTPEGIAAVRVALEPLDGIDEVAREGDWVEAYAGALAVVRTGAWVVGGVLALAALLIVASTIRLAMVARRDELEILSLVGASRSFVRAPFVLEAFVQGMLGGLLALGALWLGFGAATRSLGGALRLVLGDAEPRFYDGGEALRLVLAGALLGTIGALLAVRGLQR